MAFSYKKQTADGSTTEFTVVFSDEPGIAGKPYLSSGHLEIFLGSALQTSGYTIDESVSPPKVVFDVAPGSGTVVKINRTTPKTAAGRLVDFQDGSVLTETDLDTAAIQNLYIAQEAQDVGVGGLAKNAANTAWDANSLRLETLASAVNDTDAVTKGYVDNLALFGGGTTNPQVWTHIAPDAVTSAYVLSSPSPSSTRNEVFVVYVDGLVQAPSSNDAITVRDYKITNVSGVDYITFETGAFPSNTGSTNCPPNGAVIYVQNFGITRNIFDSPLTLASNGNIETPLTLKGIAGQTAPLLQLKDSNEVAKISMEDDGNITTVGTVTAPTVAATTLTASTLTTLGNIIAAGTSKAAGLISTAWITASTTITALGNIKASAFSTTGLTPYGPGQVACNNVWVETTVNTATLNASGATSLGTLTTSGNTTVGSSLQVNGNLTVNGTSVLQGIKGTHFAECLFSVNSWSGNITYINQSDWINVSSVTKPTSTTTARVTFTTDAPHLHLNATRVIEVAGTYYDADDYLYPPQYGPRANVGYLDVFHNGTYHSGSQAVTVRVVVF